MGDPGQACGAEGKTRESCVKTVGRQTGVTSDAHVQPVRFVVAAAKRRLVMRTS